MITKRHNTGSVKRLNFNNHKAQTTQTLKSVPGVAKFGWHNVTQRPRILQANLLAAIAYPTTKIRVNATCRKCPHKVHRMEMKTAISCTILRHTKILIAVGRSEERFSRNAETDLVCRLLLEKKKTIISKQNSNIIID